MGAADYTKTAQILALLTLIEHAAREARENLVIGGEMLKRAQDKGVVPGRKNLKIASAGGDQVEAEGQMDAQVGGEMIAIGNGAVNKAINAARNLAEVIK